MKYNCHHFDIKFEQEVISCTNAVEGHIVVAKLVRELDNYSILAEITTIIGHKNDVGIDIEETAWDSANFGSAIHNILDNSVKIAKETGLETDRTRVMLAEIRVKMMNYLEKEV